ncbi:MAG: Sjogren's syndrome/scleroderma autoantigen 1 family protein [Parachlamydiaceae bacterium]
MADLLVKGATLTDLSCPVCASPLFRLKDGTLWCEKDERKVVIVKDGETEPPKPSTNTSYDKLESTLLTKIQGLESKIEKTDDPEELQKLSCTISQLLNTLEKIKQTKKT